MTIDYIAANNTRREWLDPRKIGDGNVQEYGVSTGRFANVLAYLMAGDWYADNVQLVSDTHDDQYTHIKETFADITVTAVREMNAAYLECDDYEVVLLTHDALAAADAGNPPCTNCQKRPGSSEDPAYAGLCALCAWRAWGKSARGTEPEDPDHAAD